ncbi:hypothetical protein SDC9_155773 [bioreactor metagenome]|uniref:Uncharacterized protein n=1 Tax=bioreactor metagenome TaxID=1076179 RepID=A0A645F2K9_9ZZZZ
MNRKRGFAYDQLVVQNHLTRHGLLLGHLIVEQMSGLHAQFVTGLCYGGNVGVEHGGVLYIVKADHTDVLRHTEAEFFCGSDGAQGQGI